MKSSMHYTEFNSYTRIAALSSYNLTTNTFKKEIGEENLILSFWPAFGVKNSKLVVYLPYILWIWFI